MLPWHDMTHLKPPSHSIALAGTETLFRVQGQSLGLFAVRGWENDLRLVREICFASDPQIIDGWSRRYSLIRGLPILDDSAAHTPQALSTLCQYLGQMTPKLPGVRPNVRGDLPTPSATIHQIIRMTDDDPTHADVLCGIYDALRDAGEQQGWPLTLTHQQIGRLTRRRNVQRLMPRLTRMGILETLPDSGRGHANAYILPNRDKTVKTLEQQARSTSDWRLASLLASCLPEIENNLPVPTQHDGPTWWKDLLLPSVSSARWAAYLGTIGMPLMTDDAVRLPDGTAVGFRKEEPGTLLLDTPPKTPIPTGVWRNNASRQQITFARCPVCGQPSIVPIQPESRGLPRLHWAFRQPNCGHAVSPIQTGTEEDARWCNTLERYDDRGTYRLLSPFR